MGSVRDESVPLPRLSLLSVKSEVKCLLCVLFFTEVKAVGPKVEQDGSVLLK